MKIHDKEPNLNYDKIEIEENKIVCFLQKFWQFSIFYGEYIASLHSKNQGNFQDK